MVSGKIGDGSQNSLVRARVFLRLSLIVLVCLLSAGMIAVPFSFNLSAHLVLDYPGAHRTWIILMSVYWGYRSLFPLHLILSSLLRCRPDDPF